MQNCPSLTHCLDGKGLGEVEDADLDLTLLEDKESDENTGADPPPAKKTPPPPPFIVGEGLPVVPAKLATKIQRGELVDMAGLLKDNLEVERRKLSVAGGVMASLLLGKPPQREVPDLLSWLTSFGMYACQYTDREASTIDTGAVGLPNFHGERGPEMRGPWMARLRSHVQTASGGN